MLNILVKLFILAFVLTIVVQVIAAGLRKLVQTRTQHVATVSR